MKIFLNQVYTGNVSAIFYDGLAASQNTYYYNGVTGGDRRIY